MSYELRTRDNKEYWWPKSDHIGWDAIAGSVHQLDIVLPQIANRRCAIQAGGNNGIWPIRLATAFDTVITFEPGSTMFECLQKNIKLHAADNITAYRAALSDNTDTVTLNQHNPSNLGASFIMERNRYPYGENFITDIPAVRLDDIELEHCDFIQLDIEGYELFALAGAERLIDRCRPAIMLEINDCCTAYNFTQVDVFNHMAALYYRVAKEFEDNCLFLPLDR
jgi:FkbM family methyltransferase